MDLADPAWCTAAYLQATTYTPPTPPPTTDPTLPDILYIASRADLSDITEYHKKV